MRFVVPLVVMGAWGLGCSSEAPPPLGDGGGLVDGGRADGAGRFADSDGDGLCDQTEILNGTDPDNPDTDADGFVDFVEVNASFDPVASLSPDPTSVVFLTQDPSATVSVVPTVMVFGTGLDYSGAVEALPAPGDLARLTARDFVEETTALSASPEENVAVIETATARFLGVNGPADLAFEVRFRFGANPTQPCARGYPFRYNVKRSDGAFPTSQRFLLVVLPEGTTLAAVDWCMPDGPCR